MRLFYADTTAKNKIKASVLFFMHVHSYFLINIQQFISYL
jgi:hypothetical protein